MKLLLFYSGDDGDGNGDGDGDGDEMTTERLFVWCAHVTDVHNSKPDAVDYRRHQGSRLG